MTPDVEAELIRLWNEGVSEKRIAQQIGYSIDTVRRYACFHRDKCPYRRKRIGRQTKEMWAERVRSGRCTIAQAARALGVGRLTVRRWLKK